MGIKQWITAVALAGSSAACMSGTSPDFAITEVNGEGRLLLITATKLDPQSIVQLQFPDRQSGTQCCQRLKARQFKLSREEVVTSNKLTDGEAFIYEARIPSSWPSGPFIGMAVVGDFKHSRSQNQLLEGSAPNAPHLKATLCTSSEGVHLQARRGEQLQTHLYLWLGYDIADPTCNFIHK